MSLKQKKISIFAASIALLIIGGVIYLNFRSHSLAMFHWLRNVGLEDYFVQREFDKTSVIQSFCVFNLPDGLWSLSALILFALVWEKSRRTFYFYSITFTAGNILFEVLQFFKIISGTFDFLDCFVILISFFIGVLIYEKFIRRVQNES